MRKQAIILSGLILILSGCNNVNKNTSQNTNTAISPAKEFCLQNGVRYEERTRRDGSEYGVCILANETACEEWAYYNGECPKKIKDIPLPSANIDSRAPEEIVEKCINITDMNKCKQKTECQIDVISPQGNIGKGIQMCIPK